LQSKAFLVLSLIVLGVTLSGGWFYFVNTRSYLESRNLRDAERIANALSIAARYDLRDQRRSILQRLAGDFIQNDNVLFVAFVDELGTTVATASRESRSYQWNGLVSMPVTMTFSQQLDGNRLMVARPVVLGDYAKSARVIGGVRLVLDTSLARSGLLKVQQRVVVVAAGIVLCAMPLAFLLVWRVIVQPFRKLLAATRRLASGEFSARTGMRRNDEIGELATAFDSMAGEIARGRDKLIRANEQLERKVADRTSEINLANQRLKEEIAEKEDFLRAVSHDLNAPLRNISGMAAMIVRKWQGALPGETVARLERIQANVEAGSSLINELLELSRIKTRPQKREVVDFQALLTDLAGTFDYELKNRKIELKILTPMPSLYVERNRMRQLFQNLIDNAIKYMNRRAFGLIEISYARRDGYHEFCVADNGPGIKPEEHRKIFCVFRRAETAASTGVEGKGVGLALVKSVAANYDGRAWVDSEAGHGASFHVTLSAAATEPPADASAGGSPAAVEHAGRTHDDRWRTATQPVANANSEREDDADAD